jgi:tetratricopeptide (TPR) repeat protein
VVAAGIVLWQRQHDDLSKAQKLVASAYGERRTTEMRLTSVPYAPYNPVPIERSTEANRALDYERPDLLKAKSLVAEKLHASDKLDPRWLQVEGRIALLDPGSTNDAERALQKAQAEGLNDPSLEIDLAATYFQHASNEENPDFSPAINALTTVLDDKRVSDQDRLAALFDLAIAYQKSKMFDLAIETWEKYLKLDSSSDWAKEAQQRLQDARKAGLPPKAQAPLNSDPAFFFESPFRSGSIGNA